MNYIIQLNAFWDLYNKHNLNVTDIALYTYLLQVSNRANWANPIKHNTAKILLELKMVRSTFEVSRGRLNRAGLIYFRAKGGCANVTYKLVDFEQVIHTPTTGSTTGNHTAAATGCTTGATTLNKNNKQKPKQKEVVEYAQALQFFNETHNAILLMQRFELLPVELDQFFEIFYYSKIDLGEFNQMTEADIARNFYYWLPKYLTANKKEKKVAPKKEKDAPLKGVAAALQMATVQRRRRADE